MGSHVVLPLHEAGQEGDGLDGLAQAHLVRQDAVDVVVVQGRQELEAPQLVVAQGAPHQHVGRLHLHPATTPTVSCHVTSSAARARLTCPCPPPAAPPAIEAAEEEGEALPL